jgi:hypothetical protein
MRSKFLYILLGNDQTGKTKFQKNLVKVLSDDNRDYRLDCNLQFNVHPPPHDTKDKDVLDRQQELSGKTRHL